jgi:hypothetical protein
MQNVNIEELTSGQREQLLSELLKAQVELQDVAPCPEPVSVSGKQILEWVTNDLLDDLDRGHLDETVSHVSYGVNSAIEDHMSAGLERVIDVLMHEINQEVLGLFVGSLETHDTWILLQHDHAYGDPIYHQLNQHMMEYTSSDSIKNLRKQLLTSVAGVARRAITISVDTDAIEAELRSSLERHIRREVLPAYAQVICDYEASTDDG